MRARAAWWLYAGVAAALALLTLGHWLWAVTLRGPMLYGEGAVANAAILARDRLEYTTGARYADVSPIFAASNYPPLYFHLAGLGDPFVTGRILSIAATLFVAGAIAWRGRAAGPLVSGAIAIAWIASVPVMQWGAAVKPDLVALALTVGAVLALSRARSSPLLAGALIGVAAMAKPTALVPGVALMVFVARRDPVGAARGLIGGVVAAIAVALLTHGPDKLVRIHVVDWNALPWRPELLAPLALVALIVLAVPIATALVTRTGGGVIGAYLAGAVGVVILGGREGATINYLLDLSAALALVAASAAPGLGLTSMYPAAALGQLAIAFVLLNPFVTVPALLSPTGKWGDTYRIAAVRDLPGTLLVEDSGLLIANGRQPVVDDLFLWSRVYAKGGSFMEGDALIAAVRDGRFDAVVSEVDLERIESGPGYERQRWHPDLVAAVLARYHRLSFVTDHCQAFVPCTQLFVYTRR